ncbi:MAG: radical SAM protein [Deltaproteobacteria bacterium]|nr:radical SAM protein [Deltaproteobacteria bacterium]
MEFFGFQWHITDRCNLRCLHCYQDVFSRERERDIKTLKSYAEKIFLSGVAERIAVNITGGEPLLYPDIIELLEYINDFNSCSEINIITNGTFINDELISVIKSLPKVRYLKISIESPDEKINDRIRGQGNLKEVTENLEKFRQTKKDILIMMTLASYNFRETLGMVEYVRNNSLSGVIFERFVPLGNGKRLKGEFLKRYEWKSVIEDILRISGVGLNPEEVAQYKAFWLLSGREKMYLRAALCNLGQDSMALMPDGSVYPCRRYNKKVADINDESFENIVKVLSLYEIKNIKSRLSGEICGLCGFEDCVGCRALVYAITGDESEDDLQCFL